MIAMVHRSNPNDLFVRWFLVVYLPLGLLAIELALLPFGILPRWTMWLLVLLAAYAVLAVRLLIERKRTGLGIPLPRKIVFSLAALAAMLAAGLGLFVAGMGRLTTSRGLAMVFVGGCLMIFSVTVPAFRLVDILLRTSGRGLRRLVHFAAHGPGAGSRPRSRSKRSPTPVKSPGRPAGSTSRRSSRGGAGRPDSAVPSGRSPGSASSRNAASSKLPAHIRAPSARALPAILDRARRNRARRAQTSSRRSQQGPLGEVAAPPGLPGSDR